MIPEHYHVELVNNKDFVGVVVYKDKEGKYVIDDWLDYFEGKQFLKQYNTEYEAIKQAILLLKQKLPDGQIVHGAGCPDNKVLNTIKTDIG